MQIGIYASVCGDVPKVWLHFDFIFVVMTRGNVTLNIAIGPFVRMTLQSRPTCGGKSAGLWDSEMKSA